MNVAFDHIATSYDKSFTHTAIGKAQRNLVWQYLGKVLFKKESISILELNCGTGEDSLWLAQKGHQVVATDISSQMTAITYHKASKKGLIDNIHTQVVDIKEVGVFFENKEFDMVFSNFGGFNCLNIQELATFFQKDLPNILKPNGRFVGVIMPRFCIWEIVYFLIKLRFIKAFRRLKKEGVKANLGNGSSIWTYYFSPNMMQEILPPTLKVTHIQAIGFFIPPSYFNHTFEKRLSWLNRLEKWEQKAIQFSGLASFSDHFLIEITRIR